jgi:hypothetical protein
MLLATTVGASGFAQTLETVTFEKGGRLNDDDLLARERGSPGDVMRAASGGHLILKSKSFESGEFGVSLRRQTSKTLQATLVATTAYAQACSGFTNYVYGTMILSAFNTTANSTSDAMNDVRAIVELQRSSAQTGDDKTLAVNYRVVQCSNGDCASSIALAAGGLGTMTLNEPLTVRITWDDAGHRFVFVRDPSGQNPTTAYEGYSVTDAYPPGAGEAAIFIRHTISACDPKAHSRMELSAKDVMIDRSACGSPKWDTRKGMDACERGGLDESDPHGDGRSSSGDRLDHATP